jgi:hypothetical protein
MKESGEQRHLLLHWLLFLSLFFDPEDGGDIFLRNIG